MLSHVQISIPFIALHSTHTALQLPQSPLLQCRRNISFPANSYPLKRRKFHFETEAWSNSEMAYTLVHPIIICYHDSQTQNKEKFEPRIVKKHFV